MSAPEPSHMNLPVIQQVTPRELVEWCAARLAHYKVPAAVHILPKLPTTGSGKILKTELRAMFGGAAAPAAGIHAVAPAAGAAGLPVASAAQEPAGVAVVDASVFGREAVAALSSPQARAQATTPAEAAAVLAAACGGDIACQPLDGGLGVQWGRELLPSLTYLLVVERAADILAQARVWQGRPGRDGGLRCRHLCTSYPRHSTCCPVCQCVCRLTWLWGAKGCAAWQW